MVPGFSATSRSREIVGTSSTACALCGAGRKLERSHLIPQFVYRHANALPGTTNAQVGPARELLCGRCEDLFSVYESEFARRIFHPVATGKFVGVKYGAWLRKFAASVCWRILEASRMGISGLDFAPHRLEELRVCRETWRRYLLGKRPDVGPNFVHLLPWNAACRLGGAGSGADLTRNFGPGHQPESVHFHHLIEMEVACSGRDAFVYAKLGPVILFGAIADRMPEAWGRTRINAEGKLKPCDVTIPDCYREYLQSRAQSFAPAGNNYNPV